MQYMPQILSTGSEVFYLKVESGEWRDESGKIPLIILMLLIREH